MSKTNSNEPINDPTNDPNTLYYGIDSKLYPYCRHVSDILLYFKQNGSSLNTLEEGMFVASFLLSELVEVAGENQLSVAEVHTVFDTERKGLRVITDYLGQEGAAEKLVRHLKKNENSH